MNDKDHPDTTQQEAGEVQRLKAALKRYSENPDECADKEYPCASHMAYEDMKATIVAAGWDYDEERDVWCPPPAAPSVTLTDEAHTHTFCPHCNPCRKLEDLAKAERLNESY